HAQCAPPPPWTVPHTPTPQPPFVPLWAGWGFHVIRARSEALGWDGLLSLEDMVSIPRLPFDRHTLRGNSRPPSNRVVRSPVWEDVAKEPEVTESRCPKQDPWQPSTAWRCLTASTRPLCW